MHRIALIGYMCSGKSTVGKLLSERLNYPLVDLDMYIEEKEKMTVAEIFQTKGEVYFRQCETVALQHVLEQNSNLVLATGGGTPCFYNHMKLLNEQCITFFLHCSMDAIYDRIAGTSQERPLLINDYDAIEKHLSGRLSTYAMAHHTIHSESTTQSIVDSILDKLSR
jgi:shikimate kinase